MDDDILLEIDVEGHPRAIEILNASTHFGVDKEALVEIGKLHMKVTVTDENIIAEIVLTLLDKNMIPIIEQTQNINNVPCNNENIAVSLS